MSENNYQFAIDRDALTVTQSRTFKTTIDKLWDAMTNPEMIPQWWGRGTEVDVMDFRVGGKWRFVQKTPDIEHGFRGEYLDIKEKELIKNTFEYEPIPGHILEETQTLEEFGDGLIKVSSSSKFANLEDLEGMVASGMESGAQESWSRMASLVE